MRKSKFKFKVDRGVPLPATGRPEIYHLGKMRIGDSFAFPATRVGSVRVVAQARQQKNKKEKFTVRKVSDKSYRCWRIA